MGSSLKEVERLFQTEIMVLFEIDALYIEMSTFCCPVISNNQFSNNLKLNYY